MYGAYGRFAGYGAQAQKFATTAPPHWGSGKQRGFNDGVKAVLAGKTPGPKQQALLAEAAEYWTYVAKHGSVPPPPLGPHTGGMTRPDEDPMTRPEDPGTGKGKWQPWKKKEKEPNGTSAEGEPGGPDGDGLPTWVWVGGVALLVLGVGGYVTKKFWR